MAVPTIAYFVTPHGFGHAARSAAVMEALGRREPLLEFEIVTTVPAWFFSQSLSVNHRVRPLGSDVGLVQVDPIREDAAATVAALGQFWGGIENLAASLIRSWRKAPPRLVVSDISPLGLVVASRLGIPSVLVENFTWDWIYRAYLDDVPGLAEFSDRSAEATATATLHIQCEPTCAPLESATCVGPISRTPRSHRAETRRAIGLDEADRRPLVLLTMGGMGWGNQAPHLAEAAFFVTLGGVDQLSREPSLLRLPNRSPIYPPDLVWAAEAVIGKLGYSTVAECYRAGTRMGYMGRARFPESPVLAEFVRRTLPSIELSPERLRGSDGREEIERLLTLPAAAEQKHNGADEVAKLLLALLE